MTRTMTASKEGRTAGAIIEVDRLEGRFVFFLAVQRCPKMSKNEPSDQLTSRAMSVKYWKEAAAAFDRIKGVGFTPHNDILDNLMAAILGFLKYFADCSICPILWTPPVCFVGWVGLIVNLGTVTESSFLATRPPWCHSRGCTQIYGFLEYVNNH